MDGLCGRCRHPVASHFPTRSHPLVNLGTRQGLHTYLTVRCEVCYEEDATHRVCPMGSIEELMARFREVERELQAAEMGSGTLAEPIRALKARVRYQPKSQGASTDGKGEHTPAKH